jgi:SH3-like domain-containing protein
MRKRTTGFGRWLAAKSATALVVIGGLAGGVLLISNEQNIASVAAVAAVASEPEAAPLPGIVVGKSGLPVPRFVSLKAGRINVRVGPGEDYKVSWVFTKPDLPVEVIQEFDTWRRIRDSDGQVGWVFHSLLSGNRTAVVTPWGADGPKPLHATASQSAEVTAFLGAGVMADIDRCDRGWCRLTGQSFAGWIPQDQLWGVYQNEEVD